MPSGFRKTNLKLWRLHLAPIDGLLELRHDLKNGGFSRMTRSETRLQCCIQACFLGDRSDERFLVFRWKVAGGQRAIEQFGEVWCNQVDDLSYENDYWCTGASFTLSPWSMLPPSSPYPSLSLPLPSFPPLLPVTSLLCTWHSALYFFSSCELL